MSKPQCTYEKIIPCKRVPYWVFWPLVSIMGFVTGEIAIRVFEDNHFFWTQLLFATHMGYVPLGFTWLSYGFQASMQELSQILWRDTDEFENWLKRRTGRVFTLQSWPARFVVALTVVFAVTTVITLGLPFKSEMLNGIALIGFIPLLIVNGHAAYGLIDLLFTIREIVQRPAKVPFFMMPHPAITKLQSYYSATALSVTIGYVIMTVAIWHGPYGVSPQMQIWLTIGAFYPLSMFFWSFTQIHILMRSVKQAHLEIIKQEVQRALEKVLSSDQLEAVERLEKLMNVQSKIQAMKEWPVEVQGTLTFLITVATAVVQVVISILGVLGP